ncbi:MAG: hypothetical protein ACREPS_10495, partial [Rhodanobacteraceae bacterium]
MKRIGNWPALRAPATLAVSILAALALLAGAPPQAVAQMPGAGETSEQARLVTCAEVLGALHATPDQNVPAWLLQRAYGVAVVPDVIKAAFLFGGRYGNGVLTVRNAAGR